MKCKDCGSSRITWNIDGGSIIQEYDKNGRLIESDFHCDSIDEPKCVLCDSTNLEN